MLKSVATDSGFWFLSRIQHRRRRAAARSLPIGVASLRVASLRVASRHWSFGLTEEHRDDVQSRCSAALGWAGPMPTDFATPCHNTHYPCCLLPAACLLSAPGWPRRPAACSGQVVPARPALCSGSAQCPARGGGEWWAGQVAAWPRPR